MSITYLSHTADVRMLISAETLEELFTEGVNGMGHILKENFCAERNKIDTVETIEVKASDYTSLLIDFLSDVLSKSYIENMIFCKIEMLEIEKHKLIARLSGTRVKFFDEEIKAVTYHEADVVKNEIGHWETMVIFDI